MTEPIEVERIHQEHREWNRKHVHWLEDLEFWVKELDRAADKLSWITENMGRIGNAYVAHRETMVAQEQEIARHEHHLQRGQLEYHDAADHEIGRRAQAYQQAFHEALRQQHDRFIALVDQLEAVVKSSRPA